MPVEQDNIDSQAVAIVGVFGATVTFVIILAVQVLYYRMEKADIYKNSTEPGCAELKDVQTEQRGQLAKYGWVDRPHDMVTIPVERAMDIVVRQRVGAH